MRDVTRDILALTILLLLASLPGCGYYTYDSGRFSGDAAITDSGPWSAPPRWTIAFPPIPLDKDDTYQFTARGLPRHDLVFVLRPAGDSMKGQLARTTAAVMISIVDDQGVVILSGGGPLNPFGAHWKHSEPQFDFYLTDAPTLVVQSTDRTYTLRVTVISASEPEPGLAVHPVLHGGGNELI